MPVLQKLSHERFCQAFIGGQSAGQAYVSVYGPAKGADQSASRLLKNAQISRRIAELRSEVAEVLLADTILERKSRLKALETRWKLLNQVITERGQALGKLSIHGYPMSAPAPDAGSADAKAGDAGLEEHDQTPAPGAGTGLVCLDWRGKDAVRAVWKVDTGTLSELRAIEEQAARELGEWNPDAGPGGGVTVPVQVNVTFVSAPNAR